MTFDSLPRLIGAIETQDSWLTRRQFQQLQACWQRIVGTAVAAQTRPMGIQRQVLSVSTSSSGWAQNLMFERVRILEKLNAELSLNLTDIRFSTAQWHTKPRHTTGEPLSDSARVWRNHPSQCDAAPYTHLPQARATTPDTAFQQWAQAVQQQAQHLPLCPRCQCHCPPGELERWSVCGLCAAVAWSTTTPSSPMPPNGSAD
ncbi:MAG: DUF721 domain-containing protein [Kaiparowitsia implicata GSE-PSE-MK54-09C]|jgi:predicted nucleic acid-binding Zn ribbon protein|nr:DUF721 domain-containing protein [Kaiparowitsia implicata GSE-PSE-MK54-09C]